MISQGTISVVIGAHSVVHSLFVIIAWLQLYRTITLKEIICILLHDIGHIKLNYHDNIRGKHLHWIYGAKIAYQLFGDEGFYLCAGHTSRSGYPKSKLYWADKRSWAITPLFIIMIFEVIEPATRIKGMSIIRSAKSWHDKVIDNVKNGSLLSSHDIYLENKSNLEKRKMYG